MTQSLEQIRKTNLPPGIYPRFDWYTAMWHDCTIDQIYAFYEITQEFDGSILLDDLRSQFFGGIPTLNIEVETGVRLFITKFFVDMLDGETFGEIRSKTIPAIRVDISGMGLATMEPMKSYRICRKPLPDNAQITRADIAFDLVDLDENLMTDFHDFLCADGTLSETSRLMCFGKKSGYVQSLKWGSKDKEIMLGAPTSSRMLKFYDKKLQYTNDRGEFNPPDHYAQFSNVKKWTRIEWRLRKEDAHEVIYEKAHHENVAYFESVLKQIYLDYQIKDGRRSTGFVADFWRNLFDWQNLPAIMLNLLFVEKTQAIAVLDRWLHRSIVQILACIDIFGIDYINEVIKQEGSAMNDYNNPAGSGRRRKYMRTVSACRDGTTSESRQLGFIINESINYPQFYLQKKMV